MWKQDEDGRRRKRATKGKEPETFSTPSEHNDEVDVNKVHYLCIFQFQSILYSFRCLLLFM